MNDNELITRGNERIGSFFKSLGLMLNNIEDMARNYKPMLNGERYLTDREVSEKLKLSRRTLQDYRNEGRIPYCLLGGKILYRESDILRMLDENYHKAFR